MFSRTGVRGVPQVDGQGLIGAAFASGGTLIGPAPSAVAAAGPGEQIGAHADTVAQLAWHAVYMP